MIDKQKLHQLINTCDNEILLAKVTDLLKSEDVKDWWDELSEQDKNLVIESEMEYEKGNFINHETLLQPLYATQNAV